MIRRNFLHNLSFVPFVSLPTAVNFFEPGGKVILDSDQQQLVASASEILYGDHLPGNVSDEIIHHKLMQPFKLLNCNNGEHLKFINQYNQVVRIYENKDGNIQLSFKQD